MTYRLDTVLTVTPERGTPPFNPTSRSYQSGVLTVREFPMGPVGGLRCVLQHAGGTLSGDGLGRPEQRGGRLVVVQPALGPARPDAAAAARRFDPADLLVAAGLGVAFASPRIGIQKPWSARSTWGRAKLKWDGALVSALYRNGKRLLRIRQTITAESDLGSPTAALPASHTLTGLWDVRASDGTIAAFRGRATTRFRTIPRERVSGSGFAAPVTTVSVTDITIEGAG